MTAEVTNEVTETTPLDAPPATETRPATTLRDILVRGTELMAEAYERREAEERAREEHRATCTKTPCDPCGRFLCYVCNKPAPEKCAKCVECQLAARLERARLAIPKRFRWAIDADWEKLLATAKRLNPRMVDGGLAWARRAETSPLLLLGPSGAGKTSLVVAFFGAWLLAHRDPTGLFVTACELSTARQHHPLGHGEAPAVEHAMTAGLLVIDDIGAEQPGRGEVIAEVIRSRHDAERPTWVTTFLTHEEASKRYDGGVGRRLYEESKVVVVGS